MRIAIMLTMAAAVSNLFAINGTLITETETLKGDIRWQGRNKQYIISIMKGKTPIEMERKLVDVTGLDIPVPAGYERAVGQVEAGQGLAAIPVLEKIVSSYRMLQWDKPAGRYLVLAYLSANQVQKAYDACQPIISEDKSAAYSGDLASAYWQTLLKLGKFSQLETLLKKASSGASRQASAAALVMRGDIIVSGSNDNPEKLREALRDGYLRVVLMYQDAECRRERAEAMMKAAQVFDKLGQSGRAEKLRTQAKSI